jgi:xylulokinase
MGSRHVLAWDLGTTGAKVGIVNDQGQVIASDFEPTPHILLPDGGAEQRPEDWWNALVKATLRLLARNVVERTSIAALGVTAQWSGTVAVDRDGTPLGNAIIWMDSRGAPQIRKLTGGIVEFAGYAPLKLARWLRLTGGAPTHGGKDSLAHILYLREAQPRVYERAHKFLEPKDYLTFRLTGRFAGSFDSLALHWVTDNRDPHDVRYDSGLLSMVGIERDKLPDLFPAPHVLGRLTPEHRERFGLPADVVVTAGAPDVHSAAIGAGTTADFAVHLYVGTSSWIACHVPRKKTDVIRNMAALPAAIPGRYLLLNDQETAGACLTQLSERLFFANDELGTGPAPKDVYRRFDRIAEASPPGSRRLLFLPWLYGERTPVEDRALRGAFVNYSLGHDRCDVIRSVYEGVAYNSRWLFQYVQAFAGREIPELRFIGGGAQSDLWCQIFADVLDRPILRVYDPLLSNLRGAGLIAFVGLGQIDFDSVERRVAVGARFAPKPQNRALYDDLFDEFLRLYRSTRPSFARLNEAH